jgi:NADPH2:quinone reductase
VQTSTAYAIRIHSHGGPEVLQREDITPRAPANGEALVRQTAIGLNFIDTYHRTGLYPVKLPFTPGSEGAGVVEAVGEGVTHIRPGQRVAFLGNGTYTSHYTGAAWNMAPLPDDISEETAAAIWLKGLTAWMLLFEIRPITAADTVLIWAPVGGVGSVLTPWAAHLGARIIAVTSSEEKAEQARALGAHDVIVGYQDVAKKVRERTNGQGVHVALDSVGKVSLGASLASLRPRGWLVSYGNASGAPDPVSPARLAQGGSLVLTRAGLFNFVNSPESLERGVTALFKALRAGTIEAKIGQRFALADVASAHRALQSGTTSGATLLMP